MSAWPPICIHSVGLEEKQPYLAHDFGNWGPECEGSDCLERPLVREGVWWFFRNPERLLRPGEQFKIVVPKVSLGEAHRICKDRVSARVHNKVPRIDAPKGENFDFDLKTGCMWFLAIDNPDHPHGCYPVIHPGEWNQNNVFVIVLPA